jgi:hypothetical protein
MMGEELIKNALVIFFKLLIIKPGVKMVKYFYCSFKINAIFSISNKINLITNCTFYVKGNVDASGFKNRFRYIFINNDLNI